MFRRNGDLMIEIISQVSDLSNTLATIFLMKYKKRFNNLRYYFDIILEDNRHAEIGEKVT